MIIPCWCYNDSLRYTNTYTLVHTNTHRYTHRQHFNIRQEIGLRWGFSGKQGLDLLGNKTLIRTLIFILRAMGSLWWILSQKIHRHICGFQRLFWLQRGYRFKQGNSGGAQWTPLAMASLWRWQKCINPSKRYLDVKSKDLMVAWILRMGKKMIRDFQFSRHTTRWMVMNLRRQKEMGIVWTRGHELDFEHIAFTKIIKYLSRNVKSGMPIP